MSELIFEKVGDINGTYPYLCVYIKGAVKPFREISVTEERDIAFTLYRVDGSVTVGLYQWAEILQRAIFLPVALENEGSS